MNVIAMLFTSFFFVSSYAVSDCPYIVFRSLFASLNLHSAISCIASLSTSVLWSNSACNALRFSSFVSFLIIFLPPMPYFLPGGPLHPLPPEHGCYSQLGLNCFRSALITSLLAQRLFFSFLVLTYFSTPFLLSQFTVSSCPSVLLSL